MDINVLDKSLKSLFPIRPSPPAPKLNVGMFFKSVCELCSNIELWGEGEAIKVKLKA